MITTDYCLEALEILQSSPRFDARRVRTSVWDVTTAATTDLKSESPGAILCVFVLSAIHPKKHVESLRNMAALLPAGGRLLFRDYGVADHTMWRHRSCIEPLLFERRDNTLAYYFSLEYLKEICDQSGFVAEELDYAAVLMTNKKTSVSCKRVFVHAVLIKI